MLQKLWGKPASLEERMGAASACGTHSRLKLLRKHFNARPYTFKPFAEDGITNFMARHIFNLSRGGEPHNRDGTTNIGQGLQFTLQESTDGGTASKLHGC